MAKSQKNHSQKQRQNKQNGGRDGWQYVQEVTGAYPHQAQAPGNVIATHVPGQHGGGLSPLLPANVTASPTLMSVNAPAPHNVPMTTPGHAPIQIKGGQRKGKNIVYKLAIPAKYLSANNPISLFFAKKLNGKSVKNKKRSSRRRSYRKKN